MPSGGTLAKTALFGAVAGPLVDAVHNQVRCCAPTARQGDLGTMSQ